MKVNNQVEKMSSLKPKPSYQLYEEIIKHSKDKREEEADIIRDVLDAEISALRKKRAELEQVIYEGKIFKMGLKGKESKQRKFFQ